MSEKLIYANDKTTELKNHLCLWEKDNVILVETTGIYALLTHNEARELIAALKEFLDKEEK